MQMLTVNCSPDVEDVLIDALLEIDGVTGFTVLKAQGHGPIGAMSIAEQVAGRRNRVQVQITLADEFVHNCLRQLASELPSPDIMYWITPVLAFGRLSEAASL